MNHQVAVLVSRLPVYIREGYPKFVALMTAYYEWLLTADGVASAILSHAESIDPDSARPSPALIKDLGMEDAPPQVRRHLMTVMREFNASRGAVQSFTDFFRIYLNTDVLVSGNSASLFIPSAQCVEKYRRFVLSVPSGFRIPDSGVMTQAHAKATAEVVAVNLVAKTESQDIYEVMTAAVRGVFYFQPVVVSDLTSAVTATPLSVFAPSFENGKDFAVGDVVTVTTDLLSVRGVVATLKAPGITAVVVTTPGLGYSRGDVILADALSGGSGFSAQVSSVGSDGEVVSVEVLNAGRGYVKTPELRVVSKTGAGAAVVTSSPCGDIKSVTFPYSPFGAMATVSVDSSRGVTGTCSVQGAVSELVSMRKGVNGVVGEGTRLTDSLAWQFSSYSVETSAALDTWYEAVKTGLHPAGKYMHVVKSMKSEAHNAGVIAEVVTAQLIYEELTAASATSEGFSVALTTDPAFDLLAAVVGSGDSFDVVLDSTILPLDSIALSAAAGTSLDAILDTSPV